MPTTSLAVNVLSLAFLLACLLLEAKFVNGKSCLNATGSNRLACLKEVLRFLFMSIEVYETEFGCSFECLDSNNRTVKYFI